MADYGATQAQSHHEEYVRTCLALMHKRHKQYKVKCIATMEKAEKNAELWVVDRE